MHEHQNKHTHTHNTLTNFLPLYVHSVSSLRSLTGEVAAMRLVRGLEAGGRPAAAADLTSLEVVAGFVKACAGDFVVSVEEGTCSSVTSGSVRSI